MMLSLARVENAEDFFTGGNQVFAIDEILHLLKTYTAPILLIGVSGSGKSSILLEVARRQRKQPVYLDCRLMASGPDSDFAEMLSEELKGKTSAELLIVDDAEHVSAEVVRRLKDSPDFPRVIFAVCEDDPAKFGQGVCRVYVYRWTLEKSKKFISYHLPSLPTDKAEEIAQKADGLPRELVREVLCWKRATLESET